MGDRSRVSRFRQRRNSRFADTVSKTLRMEHGWSDRTIDSEQLYDFMFDPFETNNVGKEGQPHDAVVWCEMTG